jgi:uncharacterized protein (DUF2147 family)
MFQKKYINHKTQFIMKKIFSLVCLSIISFASAQIEGRWKTTDDETGKDKAIVEISKKTDGKYYAKIIQLLIKPASSTCNLCTDDRKDKAVLGLEIIRDLEKNDDEFSNGSILDPKKGKIYKCTISNITPDQIKVRGYIGFSLFGRNQIWNRVK